MPLKAAIPRQGRLTPHDRTQCLGDRTRARWRDAPLDCGEGTQRQMMRYGIPSSPGDIFFTHFHADHVLGALASCERCTPGSRRTLRIWGPAGSRDSCSKHPPSPANDSPSPSSWEKVTAGTPIPRHGYSIIPFGRRAPRIIRRRLHAAEICAWADFTRNLARARGIPKARSGENCTAAARSR